MAFNTVTKWILSDQKLIINISHSFYKHAFAVTTKSCLHDHNKWSEWFICINLRILGYFRSFKQFSGVFSFKRGEWRIVYVLLHLAINSFALLKRFHYDFGIETIELNGQKDKWMISNGYASRLHPFTLNKCRINDNQQSLLCMPKVNLPVAKWLTSTQKKNTELQSDCT